MNFTVARTIGYSILVVFVSFINTTWLNDSQQSFLALFILGSFVGELGIPALLPKMVEKENQLINQFIGDSVWRRASIIVIVLLLAVAGVIMTANASYLETNPVPAKCKFK